MHVIGELILAALIAWGGLAAARSVTAGVAARLPAPVRGAASRVRAARKGSRGTGSGSDARGIWAKARADDWLERRRASRARKDERRTARASRPPLEPRRLRIPRVAINVPGVTDKKPAVPEAATAPAVPSPPPPSPVPVPAIATAVKPREADPPMSMPRGSVTPHHAAVNAYVASFEPESDGDLIRFMACEAAGMAGYAHAMEQAQEHLLSSVGLDPAAVQGLTEFSQAVTEAAALMTRANTRFQQVYQGVRETVAGGTVLPYDGRWITAESA